MFDLYKFEPRVQSDQTGYENGFIILVVYNMKLSDFANSGEQLRFTMYGQDFKHITTQEDDESTIVAFQSNSAPNFGSDSMNIYYSIEGVNMDAAQHIDCELKLSRLFSKYEI